MTRPAPKPAGSEVGADAVLLLPVQSADDIPADHRVPNGIITILPEFVLTLGGGRQYRFDWHRYLGPTFLRKDGEPLARYPSERNPMWKAFGVWDRQGRRVDAEGNCIWDAAHD